MTPEHLAKVTARRAGSEARPLTSWLTRNSLLYTLARTRIDNLRYRLRSREAKAAPDAEETEVTATHGPAPEYMRVFEADPPAETIARWEQAWNTLDAFSRLAEENGARFAVFYIPAQWQLSDDAMARWAGFYGVDPAGLDRHKPQDMLREWAGRSGELFIDLLPDFEPAPPEENYFPHDLHWSPRGHALAAEALVAALRDAGVL
jgi:hypothetical protein